MRASAVPANRAAVARSTTARLRTALLALACVCAVGGQAQATGAQAQARGRPADTRAADPPVPEVPVPDVPVPAVAMPDVPMPAMPAPQVSVTFGGPAPSGLAAGQRPAPTRYLDPAPVVHLRGRILRTRFRVVLLTVTAPAGSAITVRCRGRGCPSPGSVARIARRAGRVRFASFERPLARGAVLEITVTRSGRIGRYTRFTIGRRLAPRRLDRCLPDGAARPLRCPVR